MFSPHGAGFPASSGSSMAENTSLRISARSVLRVPRRSSAARSASLSSLTLMVACSRWRVRSACVWREFCGIRACNRARNRSPGYNCTLAWKVIRRACTNSSNCRALQYTMVQAVPGWKRSTAGFHCNFYSRKSISRYGKPQGPTGTEIRINCNHTEKETCASNATTRTQPPLTRNAPRACADFKFVFLCSERVESPSRFHLSPASLCSSSTLPHSICIRRTTFHACSRADHAPKLRNGLPEPLPRDVSTACNPQRVRQRSDLMPPGALVPCSRFALPP